MPPISVMLKPASGNCNLRCKYCFYRDEQEKRSEYSLGMMEFSTCAEALKKAVEFAGSERVYFAFQGGEPLLRGKDFFREVGKAVKKKGKRREYRAFLANERHAYRRRVGGYFYRIRFYLGRFFGR